MPVSGKDLQIWLDAKTIEQNVSDYQSSGQVVIWLFATFLGSIIYTIKIYMLHLCYNFTIKFSIPIK